jgi:hypothetical protein
METDPTLDQESESTASGRVANTDTTGAGDSDVAVRGAVVAMESLDAFRDQPLSSGAPQDVQSMREKLDEAWAALLGVSDEAAAIVEYERGQQRAWANRDGAFDHHFPPTVADPVTDRGRMWWAHSEWSTAQSPIELFGFWDNDASGVKFVGQIVWDDGDLLSGVVARARGIFGLGSDRLPPRGAVLLAPYRVASRRRCRSHGR